MESFYLGEWRKIIRGRSRQFCEGYMYARRDSSPRLAHRLVKADGSVVASFDAYDEVSIGMIAGWPTAEQYEGAAARALQKAAVIRGREQRERR